jgi:ATP-dependent helicase/DNAse subunit B
MTSSDVIVLMTEESIKYDLSWKRIFQKVDFQANENLMINNLEKNSIDYFEKITNLKFEGVLSSTRIQSFIDCPRKFYFSHIKKISPRYEHSTFVTPLLLGEITHAVIEKYFILDSKNDLSVITDEILVKTLELKSIKLEEKIRDEIFYTVFHRAKNGVEVLSSIGKVLNQQIGWNLEFPFDFKDDFHIKGKIDCCAIVDDTVILIDFKSSAVPSLMEIETFQNIQIWMYLDAILKTNSHRKFESVLLGFISLDNPETSKFLSTNSDVVEAFKGSSLFGVKFIKEPFDELAQRSKDYLMNTFKNIFEETHFRPKPRKESICLFCDLSISCSKGRSI